MLLPSGRGKNVRDGFAVTGDDGFTHIYFGGLCECADGMDVVVEDDDPHHDTQTEGNGLLTAEAAAVLSVSKTN